MKPRRQNTGAAPSPYHHGNLRRALIEAGQAMIEHEGISDPSLRELARRVGVTANAAYRHFQDKEDLLAAIAAEGIRAMVAQQRAAADAASDPRDRLVAIGQSYVAFARSHPALYRLMFGTFSARHRTGELAEADRAASGLLTGALQDLIGPDAPARTLVLSSAHAWSLVHGLSLLVMDGQLADMDADVDAIVTELLDAVAIVVAPREARPPRDGARRGRPRRPPDAQPRSIE
jgi:AcrR family transcriptional regulator